MYSKRNSEPSQKGKAMLGMTDVEWVDQGTRRPVARESWKCEAMYSQGMPKQRAVLTHPPIREQKAADTASKMSRGLIPSKWLSDLVALGKEGFLFA